MKVTVCGRESIERIISEGTFPKNTAVISFYDPAIKRIDQNYSHMDYSGMCRHVFYSELDDLDLEFLREKGYTYDTYFPEADDIAAFIYQAYDSGMDIICQCEYGQSRSAGCAAAILEHFYCNGISIFANYDYYPNQVVYHKIYDALEKQKRYCRNLCYYAAAPDVLEAHQRKMQIPKDILPEYSCGSSRSAVDTKNDMEQYLSEHHLLCRSVSDIITRFLNGTHSLYASFSVTEPNYMCDCYLWEPYAVYTHFRYGYERIPVVVWFDRYRLSDEITRFSARKKAKKKCEHQIGYRQIKSFDFFGKLSWDPERKMIDAVPLMITNLQLHYF